MKADIDIISIDKRIKRELSQCPRVINLIKTRDNMIESLEKLKLDPEIRANIEKELGYRL